MDVRDSLFQGCDQAGVGRFIPDNFECDTKTIPYGKIDIKKDFASGVSYTLVFNHCISQWMLLVLHNMDYYHIIEGDVDYTTCHSAMSLLWPHR